VFFKNNAHFTLKFRLIKRTIIHKRPVSEGKTRTHGKYWLFMKRPLFLVLVVFCLLSITATPVHAGILSFWSSLFGTSDAKVVVVHKNSQNLTVLQAALNIDPNPSKGGGNINIEGGTALVPDSGPLGTLSDREVSARPDQISIYVVREGDSLSQIAEMFDVSVNTIIWANDIRGGGAIQVGQTLVILPVSGIQHDVKKGDTVNSIAKKYGVDADEIILHNDIGEGYALVQGDTILIPGGKIQTIRPVVGSVSPQASGPSYAGYYLRPISGGTKSQGLHGYNGVDLAVLEGSPIYASADGEVLISRTGWNGGYGNYIVIQHDNGTQTLYAHNSGNIVYAGQKVVQGQVIGYVGKTGRSTGPHVHFEVRGAQNPF